MKAIDDIEQVCSECGIEANRLTCLERYGREPLKPKFDVSTWHEGVCDFCGQTKAITEARDFFYPKFELLRKEQIRRELRSKG